MSMMERRATASSPSTSRHTAIRYGLILITASTCMWIQHIHISNQIPVPITQAPPIPIHALTSDLTTALTPLVSNKDVSAAVGEDEADAIIRRAYERTYAKILPCSDNINGVDCIRKTRTHFKPPVIDIDDDKAYADETASTPSVPWWFQTLLRDLPTSGVYGAWQHMNTASPPMQFCSISKIATTEWNKIFCMLNNDRNNIDCNIDKEQDDDDRWECWNTQCKHTTAEEGLVPSTAPKAAFIRDPLERLLSAYLNKCYSEHYRRNEKRCEPVDIFGREYDEVEVLKHIQDSDKQMFAAYLDIMPLKWELHFIPQVFNCDLYRQIKQYDFIGNMDGNFMSDLNRLANQFGGPLPDILDKFFKYKNYTISEEKHVNVGSKAGHGTLAPSKVTRFYTPQSLRRALEYLSIDYVMLGLQVPEWARKMLREDAV